MRRSLFSYHHIFSGSSKSLHITARHPEVIIIIFFSIVIVSCKSIPKRPMKVLNNACRLHRNPSGKTASPLCYGRDAACLISFCFHALNRAILISTLPPKKPFIYAGFKPHFCGYFSEYSENLALTDSKVGKGEIVFFQVQF